MKAGLANLKALLTGDNTGRQARRAEIKKERTKADLVRRRIKALQEQRRKVEAGRDAAADEHSRGFEQLQPKIASNEAAQEKYILAGELVPAHLVDEQHALFEQRTQLNLQLQARIAEIDKHCRNIEGQIAALNTQANDYDRINGQLVQPGIGDPNLIRQLNLARGDIRMWADRLSVASKNLDVHQTNHENALDRVEANKDAPDYESFVLKQEQLLQEAEWEMDHCREQHEAAMQRAKDIRQQLIDE